MFAWLDGERNPGRGVDSALAGDGTRVNGNQLVEESLPHGINSFHHE